MDDNKPASAPPGPPWRRRLTLAALGTAAIAAGAWWSLRQRAGSEPSPEAAALWSQVLDTPNGGTLAFADLRGKPLLLNFWATWCAPCVREMPLFDRFFREHGQAGWQVVGVAIDSPTSVRQFLAKHPVSYPVALAGVGGTELSRTLGNTAGALPFTVMFDAAGRIVQRKPGETSLDELKQWAASAA